MLVGLMLWAGAAAAQSEADRLAALAPTLSRDVLERALGALECSSEAKLRDEPILVVIDYSLPSTAKRMWVFDRSRPALLYNLLVAHGMGTGENRAVAFSNREGSKQSSLGLFRTAETYQGRNGYSLRLDGLDAGVNDRARERTIVIHGAWYVSRDFAREHGRLGRSWGCPALERGVSRQVIDTIKDGAALFISAEDPRWLARESGRSCVVPHTRVAQRTAVASPSR
ncbi:MAG: murein L,D-transpeptidase catalytic domain family protein [Thermoanaerobaculia bacterium]